MTETKKKHKLGPQWVRDSDPTYIDFSPGKKENISGQGGTAALLPVGQNQEKIHVR